MKHTVHTLTPEVLVTIYGDSSDWCSVFKNGKRVGYFSDLRKDYLKKQALKDQAEKRKFHAELMKDDSIKSAKKFFEENLKDAHVFINETQPNVHINGSKCYIICGPTSKVRLSLLHSELSFDEMINLTGRDAKPSTSKRQALWDNLEYEEALEIITTLCS